MQQKRCLTSIAVVGAQLYCEPRAVCRPGWKQQQQATKQHMIMSSRAETGAAVVQGTDRA